MNANLIEKYRRTIHNLRDENDYIQTGVILGLIEQAYEQARADALEEAYKSCQELANHPNADNRYGHGAISCMAAIRQLAEEEGE